MMELDVLNTLQPFKGFNAAQLEKLKPHCEEIEFHQGDKLFTEGDLAEHLWVVRDGCVDLRFEMPDHRKPSVDQTVASIEVAKRDPESKVLGWSCFVPPHKMRLSAVCNTDRCKIVRVPRSDLLRLFQTDPQMGYTFMSYMITVVGYRFQQFRDHVAKNLGEDLMAGW